MKFTQSFTKTIKEAPKDEVALNAILMERAGFVHKNLAGVYTILPMGMRVMRKIEQIVREEMNAIGGQEMVMNALQDKEIWDQTGRWNDYKGDMYQFNDPGERETGLAPSHEEVVTDIAKQYITSYKDLPKAVYQFQTKYRYEARPKSGLLRGREFRMKDMYSFHASQDDFQHFYNEAAKAYKKAFDRMGLTTIYVEASGGKFTPEHSHEFQVLCETGEDTVHYTEEGDFAENKEIYKGQEKSPKGHAIKTGKAIEVGNIFPLGPRYTKAMGLEYTDQKGQKHNPIMGCYGIGITRLMGTLAEVYHDAKGIIWPAPVAPFQVHLLHLGTSEKVQKLAGKLYNDFMEADVEVLYDDRDVQAGEKFADADLIGIPQRVVVSEKSLEKDSVELKIRGAEAFHLVPVGEIIKKVIG